MKKVLLVLGCLGLAGCGGAGFAPVAGGGDVRPPSGSYPTGLDNTCDAERFAPLVGQDATALERILFMGQVRVNRPGSLTTQDYRPERINFEVDASGRISEIRCG